jgi:membrane-bound lytic murein transglycosylase B
MKKNVLLILLSCFISSTFAEINQQTVDDFIKTVSENNELDQKVVSDIINNAERQQSIIDAMNRPAEKQLKWHEYRNIFLQPQRINQGVEFWEQHQQTLEKVSKDSGVPIEIIVAIIGVETSYGKIMGNYRVIDALYTLAFDYPKRSKFFTKELEKFIVLTQKEKISAFETKGSYAGAMGYGQFMPSSYLMYAKDFDNDNQRDLLSNIDDAIASVANYFKAHGWKKSHPVAYLAETNKKYSKLEKQDLKPSLTVKQLNSLGYKVKHKLSATEKVSLTQLEQENGMEYWFGLHNFYVITRYNHSEMYAMAVFQLSQEIKAKYNKKQQNQ